MKLSLLPASIAFIYSLSSVLVADDVAQAVPQAVPFSISKVLSGASVVDAAVLEARRNTTDGPLNNTPYHKRLANKLGLQKASDRQIKAISRSIEHTAILVLNYAREAERARIISSSRDCLQIISNHPSGYLNPRDVQSLKENLNLRIANSALRELVSNSEAGMILLQSSERGVVNITDVQIPRPETLPLIPDPISVADTGLSRRRESFKLLLLEISEAQRLIKYYDIVVNIASKKMIYATDSIRNKAKHADPVYASDVCLKVADARERRLDAAHKATVSYVEALAYVGRLLD